MIDSYISAAEARAKRVEVLIEEFIKDDPKRKKKLDRVFNTIQKAASEGKDYVDITALDYTVIRLLVALGYQVDNNCGAFDSYSGIEKKIVYKITWFY